MGKSIQPCPTVSEIYKGPENSNMACRVGMAKAENVDKRIAHWKETEGYTHSRRLHKGLSYDDATKREHEEAEKKECVYSAGGQRDEDHDWCVYHLWTH